MSRAPAFNGVADIATHFNLRWREVTSETLPAPAKVGPAGDTELQIVRTVPERIYKALPNGDFGILEVIRAGVRWRQALHLSQNQFLWSPEIAAILRDKIEHPPSDDFRILLLLPSRPNTGADDTRGVLGELLEATPNADGSSPRRSSPGLGRAPTRSMSTRRSASSTTTG